MECKTTFFIESGPMQLPLAECQQSADMNLRLRKTRCYDRVQASSVANRNITPSPLAARTWAIILMVQSVSTNASNTFLIDRYDQLAAPSSASA